MHSVIFFNYLAIENFYITPNETKLEIVGNSSNVSRYFVIQCLIVSIFTSFLQLFILWLILCQYNISFPMAAITSMSGKFI